VVAVARAAGVSASTVSNAFNRPERLSPELRERGLSVPGDLSIVGFDDTAPASEDLTSVHQPLRDKGRVAAERLLSSGPPGPSEPLPTSLVVRGSTAPPS
jgi:DNA-binding LacI/PurR family transcriptional regulator